MNKIFLVIVTTLAVSCKTKVSDVKKVNMTYIKSEVTTKSIVKLETEIVWNKLIVFGGTERFVPELIERVDVKGSRVGAIRNIYLKDGGEIVEKLTKIDIEKYTMEFVILSTPMPVYNYTGIFKLQKFPNHQCEVTFISKYSVLPHDKNTMETIIKEFQETFISNLDK